MTRCIYNTAKSSPTKYLNQITNLIPLGMKALTQKIKTLYKMEKFYPQELRLYEKIFG